MPDNTTPWWLSYSQKPGADNSNSQISMSGPAYDRVTSIPSWLPALNTHELTDQYSQVGNMFDTSAFDRASGEQQSRILTSALNSGNNAATEYANRARQSGGSGMGAGLIKAQATTGARKVAGEMALEKEKFDASQREKAAGLSSQIAQTLGGLRDSYLKSIVDYATKEDTISADYKAKMAALESSNRTLAGSGGGYRGGWTATVPNNMGLASGLMPSAGNVFTGQYSGAPAGWRPGMDWNFGRRG